MFSRYIKLGPTISGEIRRTRPCVIISPNEMNFNISTVIVVPLSSKFRAYPSGVACKVEGRDGRIVLDQIRIVDEVRIVRKIDTLKKLHR